MKKYSVLFAVFALLSASLACQTVMGGGNGVNQIETLPPVDTTVVTPEVPNDQGDAGPSVGADFPLPDDAVNVVSVSGTVNFQTKLNIDEVMAFYRDTYGKQGLTERDTFTTISDGVFSFVFDGDPSGKAILIQGFDVGDGTTNVSITLQDL